MILTCPACGTQYAVKDGAIPPQGRKVRCASCKHSWHEQPVEESPPADRETIAEAALIEPRSGPEAEQRAWEGAALAAEQPEQEGPAEARPAAEPAARDEWADERAQRFEEDAPAGQAPAEQAPAVNEWRPDDWRPVEAAAPIPPGYAPVEPAGAVDFAAEPEPERPQPAVPGDTLYAHEPTGAEPAAEQWAGRSAEPAPEPAWTAPAHGRDEVFSPFVLREPEPRRRSPWLTLLLVALLIAAAAAAFWFLAPAEWKQRVGIAVSGETPLQLMMTHSDRQKLASGNELLAVSGRVINPTDRNQDVPPIQAQLRSSTGRLVYSWTIAPPARTLPPGASATFNSAEVNVPAGGDELTITLGPSKA